MKLIKEKFDQHYHENFIYREAEYSQRNQQRLKMVTAYTQQGSLLEVGCGKAGFLRLAEQFFDVEAIDVSVYAIQAIQPHFGKRVRVSNIEHHPLPGSHYNVVAAFNILEHLSKPAKIIGRLYHSLANQGIFVGSVPNRHGLIGNIATGLGNFFDKTHVSTFTPDAWRKIMTHAGFKQVEFFGEITIGRNYCHYIRHPIWSQVSFNLMFVCRKT